MDDLPSSHGAVGIPAEIREAPPLHASPTLPLNAEGTARRDRFHVTGLHQPVTLNRLPDTWFVQPMIHEPVIRLCQSRFHKSPTNKPPRFWPARKAISVISRRWKFRLQS